MEFFARIAALPSKTPVDAPTNDITFVTNNTKGKRFRICREDVAEMLKSILQNIGEFNPAAEKYEQLKVRRLFEKHFKGVCSTTAGNQTKLTYALLAKVIWLSNDGHLPLDEDRIVFTAPRIRAALRCMYEDSASSASGTDAAPSSSGDFDRVTGGVNLLLSGAPGTGKSHFAEQMAEAGSVAFRCSFSKHTQNSDFFGGVRSSASHDKTSTVFEFKPGVFLLAYAHAWSCPHDRVFLVIDEINRAEVGAVLGDLFTLLDRNPDGSGRYGMHIGNDGSAKWLTERLGYEPSELRLPSNLWIVSTMNASDQSVSGLDTAFLRRWDLKHMPIDADQAPPVAVQVPITASRTDLIDYRKLLPVINSYIVSKIGLSEDRRVGQFYLPSRALKEGGPIPEALMTYLWSLTSRNRANSMFSEKITSRDMLVEFLTSGKPYFRPELLDQMKSVRHE